MKSNEFTKSLLGVAGVMIALVAILYVLSGFGHRERRADDGVEKDILHIANGSEPEDIDPHITTGVTEFAIQMALFEGLVSEDPVDLHPVPGVAESWEISDDGLVYTFHFRDAKWSNGDPVTAKDFELSYKRALSPAMGNEYAYMLFYLENGEAYFKGEIDDFSDVGATALDDKTLELRLHSPTPFFLSLLTHHSWYPVHIASVLAHGELDSRSNKWTRPKNFVGNGPFVLKDWVVNHVLTVEKNPLYWDAEQVSLKEIRFYPIESLDTEERAFRAGQIHKTNKLPLNKIPVYIENQDPNLLTAAYLGNYHYILNTDRPPLDDVRVRRALNMSIDRDSIVKNVTRGGEVPAYSLVPPDCAGYNSRYKIEYNPEKARQLLAEAGYPNGEGFPSFSILYNTLESHKTIAEAIQQMWKENLGIEVGLENQEWKVYLNSKTQGDFDIARYGWIGDYVDPNTFLDLFLSYGGNNDTNWGSEKYDSLIQAAGRETDPERRYEYFQQAEEILLEELPFVPVYYYTTVYLLDPRVKGWYPNILDHQPYKYVHFEDN